jgi:type II secretory pathway pseudopilin PulG
MNPTSHGHTRGFTLVEAIVSGAILAFLALGVTQLIDKPAKIAQRIGRDQTARSLDSAVNTIIKDLQEGSYQTIASNLSVNPATGIPPFAQYRFDGATRKLVWISFQYDPQSSRLWRVEDTTLDHSAPNPKKTLLMDNVTPAFSLDPSPNSNIVIVKMTYRVPGAVNPSAPDPGVVVRERVAVRQ